MLLSQELTGENYTSWHRAMIISFSAKNKTGLIDGAPSATDDLLLGAWTGKESSFVDSFSMLFFGTFLQASSMLRS